MRPWIALISIAAALTSAVPTARAEENEPPPTTYSFDDELVAGDLIRPMGERLVIRTATARRSLIRPRAHFVPEMLGSVEDL